MRAPAGPAAAPSALGAELAGAAVELARRFAAGATMWCVAPGWPAHARHVAVEFVHPVIVGKRALPAVQVGNDDLESELRLLSRPGDVLLAVGAAEEPRIRHLLPRAEAWGLTRLWIGAGPRPGTHRAEHLIWTDDVDPDLAARSGDLVLSYHLLWELTQVVFEHPGLLVTAPDCGEEVCVTCSDEGRVAEVRSASGDDGSAEVLVGGLVEHVDVSLVEAVRPGDLLLVHAGVAITAIQTSAGAP